MRGQSTLNTETKPTQSNLSAASLVLGIIGVFIPCMGFFLALLGILFADRELRGIKQGRYSKGTRGIAIAGLMVGTFALIFQIVVWVFINPIKR